MAPPKKPISGSVSATLMNLAGQSTEIRPDFDAVEREVIEARRRQGDVPQAFNALTSRKALDEAVEACRREVAANPNSPLSLWRLADALRDRGDVGEAISLYRRCAEFEETRVPAHYFLAAFGLEDAPTTTPEDVVVTLYDSYADTFEDMLVGALKYQGPSLLHTAIKSLPEGARTDLDILDAGCGTGLCGEMFRPMARRLDGVDLSQNMLTHAASKRLYDNLANDEICTVLRARPRAYDLVLAGDVLIYLGDLEPLFEALPGALKEGGLFAFTTERCTGTDVELSDVARYRHGDAYIARLAQGAGLTVAYREDCFVRFEKGEAVDGSVFVLRLARAPAPH